MAMVAPRIRYGRERIFSSGITIDFRRGRFAHLYGSRVEVPDDYFMNVPRNCLAVSELCFVLSREAFDQMGGYEDAAGQPFLANLDLALRLYKAGYRHLCTPFVNAYNSDPVRRPASQRLPARLRQKWRDAFASDPYYSPNLSSNSTDFMM
jgi:GT2 family glycosyltransferase